MKISILVCAVFYVIICNAYHPPSPVASRGPQTLTFIEPTTGQRVTLVGSMHYNPHSIAISREAAKKSSTVLVESCYKRWEKTLKNQAKGSWRRNLLDNEMQAASEIVEEVHGDAARVILGDQAIDLTNTRMKETLVDSLKDVVTFRWDRVVDDLKTGYELAIAVPDDRKSEFLDASDFFSPRLMLGTPASLFRYPAALVLKAPLAGGAIVSTLVFSLLNAGDSSFLYDDTVGRIFELTESILVTIVEAALLGRTFLIALLAERNVVLAESIRKACQQNIEEGRGDGVSAILGMAHVNGVKKLLEEP
jgi:pheromone shutdown protein TraB